MEVKRDLNAVHGNLIIVGTAQIFTYLKYFTVSDAEIEVIYETIAKSFIKLTAQKYWSCNAAFVVQDSILCFLLLYCFHWLWLWRFR